MENFFYLERIRGKKRTKDNKFVDGVEIEFHTNLIKMTQIFSNLLMDTQNQTTYCGVFTFNIS